jgi:hypothetical protein
MASAKGVREASPAAWSGVSANTGQYPLTSSNVCRINSPKLASVVTIKIGMDIIKVYHGVRGEARISEIADLLAVICNLLRKNCNRD